MGNLRLLSKKACIYWYAIISLLLLKINLKYKSIELNLYIYQNKSRKSSGRKKVYIINSHYFRSNGCHWEKLRVAYCF